MADHIVGVSSPDVVTRRSVISGGMAAEIVQIKSHGRFEFRFRAPVNLLVVHEQGARCDDDTFIEGLSRSNPPELGRKLTFLPAGHAYREWQEPRTLASLMFVYFDPEKLRILVNAGIHAGIADVSFAQRLFFDDATLLDTALKLKGSIESRALENQPYLEALGIVLVHELIRSSDGTRRSEAREGPQHGYSE